MRDHEVGVDERSPGALIQAGAVAGLLTLVLALVWIGVHRSPDQSTPPGPRPSEVYPVREVWGPVHSTSANVSHFTFRDVHRSGSWDVDDRPMAGIAVRMLAPDGTQTIRRSNIHGFVNFTNSLSASPVDVRAPGEYVFEVIIPPGWELTSANAIQTGVYESAPESRPGIVVDRVPEPAGLAPILSVEGRVVTSEARTGTGTGGAPRVEAVTPAGDVVPIVLEPDGSFRFPAHEGAWRVRVRDPDRGDWTEREITVGRAPVRMAAIVPGQAYMPRGSVRRVVDFEDVTGSPITKMPNGYAGLRWTNLVPVDNEMYSGEGYVNNTVSGTYVAYNTSGYPVSIEADEPFDFVGGYFGVAWAAAEGELLEVRAWRGQELTADETLILSALGPLWFDADFRGITKLELSTRHHWQFVADDLEFAFR